MTTTTTDTETTRADADAIRALIDNWILWRDAGDWDRFRTVFHPGARVLATWQQGSADDFIKASQEGWERGVSILHSHGGTTIEIAGDRAIAQTKMTIAQRADVEGVISDVVCTGRFFDFFDKRDGRWGMVLRQPIYERDRIDPVTPGAQLDLDPELLARFPEGYRHLAYLQSRLGYPVKTDMPGITGSRTDALYALGRDWLAGTVDTLDHWT
ncbi:nuclear transport factor 2 family protein [Streptomyces thermocoprophilus]|uniref:Nuclear transport factor 2 family protein n=1 Tax=Streptomyces thermocoprophilus TaxID=78356 RepID=A0ABV5VEX8_9ACTN